MKIIDLFAGCGGFSIGFEQAGYEISKAVEFDESIAKTYSMNHKNVNLIIDDIKNVDNSNHFKSGEAEIIIGGPPCQGFSMAGKKIRNGFIEDPRNRLFKHYFNIVKKVKPKIFVMENVKGLVTMQKGQIFNEIISTFKNKEIMDGDYYNVYYRIVKTTDYGIPQKRERVIVFGVLNKEIDLDYYIKKTKERIILNNPDFFSSYTIGDAISNIPNPTKEGVTLNPKPQTKYQEYLKSNDKLLSNHIITNHSKIAIERMNKINGGENFTKLNEEIKSVHSGSYGRLKLDGIAPTITTRFDTPSGGMYIHPLYNRTITPREAARIQSFPDDFIFYGNKTSICKQIGNAVPPKLSYFLAELTKEILNENIF